jgi:hypothetical protein
VLVRANRAFFSVTNTTTTPYVNWLFQLNVLTGGTPKDAKDLPLTVFDLNNDFQRDINDRVDGNNDGDRDDLADVPVAMRLTTGITPIQLVSHPIVARVANGVAAILYTKEGVEAVAPPAACEIGCTGGFQGGHIDVDYYDRVDGVTDGHKHRYDKDQHVVYVDLFSLEPFKRETLKRVTEIVSNKHQKFLVLIANADLSPGGKLYIGSAPPVKVIDYQRAMIDKIRNGTLTNADLHTLDELETVLLPGNDPTESFGTISGALRIAYNDASILAGDLMPTNTGCVNKGPSITYGRWHNGTLTLQLIKVNNLQDANKLYQDGKVVIQTKDPNDPYPSSDQYTGVRVASPSGASDFLYEVTLFWHWKEDDIPWFTAESYLYQQLYGNQLSLACYGGPLWWTTWKYIREGLSANELAQLQEKADQLASSGNRRDAATAQKINQALQEYKQKFQQPGSGGGSGVPEVLPGQTEGGGTSSGGQTNDYFIQQGLRSWRELGRD